VGVALHHLLVGEHVGPADVERPVHVRGEVGRVHEVVQDVANRDGLDAGLHPDRCGHHRQPLGEVAQHLERRAAAPDDHGRLEHRRRDTAGDQDLPDLLPAAQVRAQLLVLRDEPAQVDDPLHTGVHGRLGEGPGRPSVELFEVVALPDRVDEVVGDVDVAQRLPDDGEVEHVRVRQLHAVRPRLVTQLDQLAGPRADGEPGIEKLRDQTSPDVPRRSGDQCTHT